MKGLWSILLLCAALAATVARADDEGFTAPPAPDDGILDQARMFARSPERHAAVAESLAGLEEKHGFRLYYALFDSLYGRSLEERAHVLRDAWLGDRPGMVLVLETDSRAFQIGRAEPGSRETEGGERIPVPGESELPLIELTGLIRGLEGPLRDTADREAFAEKLGIGMAEGVAMILRERAAAPEGSTRPKMIALAVGLIAATGLIALLVVAGLKRAESKAMERYVFPKIGVGIRLGAPFGGGKVISRSFRNHEPER